MPLNKNSKSPHCCPLRSGQRPSQFVVAGEEMVSLESVDRTWEWMWVAVSDSVGQMCDPCYLICADSRIWGDARSALLISELIGVLKRISEMERVVSSPLGGGLWKGLSFSVRAFLSILGFFFLFFHVCYTHECTLMSRCTTHAHTRRDQSIFLHSSSPDLVLLSS